VKSTLTRVVVVEHGRDDAFVLSHLLEKAGVQITPQVFTTGEAALDYLSGLAKEEGNGAVPSVIFVNVWQTGLGGLELVRWVRHQPKLSSVVTVLLSRADEPRDLGKAARVGADCYLVKFPSPVVMREILAAIERQLETPWPRSPLAVASNLLMVQAEV
jgi:CheY-like chemotaxis protein